MMIIPYFLALVAICAGQPSSQIANDCAGNCLKRFSEYADSLMPSSTSPPPPTSFLPVGAAVQIQLLANQTGSCPAPFSRSDLDELEKVCGTEPVMDLTKCLDSCPDGVVQDVSPPGAFKPVVIMCAGKIRDLQQYLPCLSEACGSVQRTCMPKCGSVDRLTAKLRQMAARAVSGGGERYHRIRRRKLASAGQSLRRVGVEPITSAPVFGASSFPKPGSTASGGSSDLPGDKMAQILGKLCTAVDCHVHCDKMPIIEKCGKAASVFSEDLLKTFFYATLNEMITAFGFHHQAAMPSQCKALIDESKIAASNADLSITTAAQRLDVTTPASVSPGTTSTSTTTNATPPENKTTTGYLVNTSSGSMVAMPSLLLLTILTFAVVKVNDL